MAVQVTDASIRRRKLPKSSSQILGCLDAVNGNTLISITSRHMTYMFRDFAQRAASSPIIKTSKREDVVVHLYWTLIEWRCFAGDHESAVGRSRGTINCSCRGRVTH